MITFQHGQRRFNLRVAAIIQHGDRVLLHRSEVDDFWALPGGRPEIGEPMVEAIRREMHEELGLTVAVERLVWVADLFFDDDGLACHELDLLFLVHLPPDCPLLGQSESIGIEELGEDRTLRLIFRWFPLAELPALRLFPTFLRTDLADLPATTTYRAHRDIIEA